MKSGPTHTSFAAAVLQTSPYDSLRTRRVALVSLLALATGCGTGESAQRAGSRSSILTVPDMHDERFATLDEVLEHCVRGWESGHGEPAPLSPDVEEKWDLLVFLKTLDGPVVSLPAGTLMNMLVDTP